eukprot:CAMPEP_0168746022 /NCGR_PEP_ID=MMETSP0724-20121128/14920_1 /TAXON_ID=265536 /ORGANISM="Amphiprora sp., Strain CCMP467" /LENGTH=66 /DNA_ID=CAMNT_0008793755 /DNA_START=38 /DNA_END=238 /DNA_ORIENTATION=+
MWYIEQTNIPFKRTRGKQHTADATSASKNPNKSGRRSPQATKKGVPPKPSNKLKPRVPIEYIEVRG